MSEQNSVPLTINFANAEAAKHFAMWLDGQGEQSYWDWMEVRESELEGPITAHNFEYHHPAPGEQPSGENFMRELTINTTCGRLDR